MTQQKHDACYMFNCQFLRGHIKKTPHKPKTDEINFND